MLPDRPLPFAPQPQQASALLAALRAKYGQTADTQQADPAAVPPAQGFGLGGEGNYGGDDYAHAGWGTAQPFDYGYHDPYGGDFQHANQGPVPSGPVPSAMPNPGRPSNLLPHPALDGGVVGGPGVQVPWHIPPGGGAWPRSLRPNPRPWLGALQGKYLSSHTPTYRGY